MVREMEIYCAHKGRGRGEAHPPPPTPLGGTIRTLGAPTGVNQRGAEKKMRAAVGGGEGVEKAKGRAKPLSVMLGDRRPKGRGKRYLYFGGVCSLTHPNKFAGA